MIRGAGEEINEPHKAITDKNRERKVSQENAETIFSMEIHSQTSREAIRRDRPIGVSGSLPAVFPAVGGTGALGIAPGRNPVSRQRIDQYQGDTAQPGLDLALLGREAVQPGRQFLHPPRLFLQPCQPHPQELDCGGSSRRAGLSHRGAEGTGHPHVRRLVGGFLDCAGKRRTANSFENGLRHAEAFLGRRLDRRDGCAEGRCPPGNLRRDEAGGEWSFSGDSRRRFHWRPSCEHGHVSQAIQPRGNPVHRKNRIRTRNDHVDSKRTRPRGVRYEARSGRYDQLHGRRCLSKPENGNRERFGGVRDRTGQCGRSLRPESRFPERGSFHDTLGRGTRETISGVRHETAELGPLFGKDPVAALARPEVPVALRGLQAHFDSAFGKGAISGPLHVPKVLVPGRLPDAQRPDGIEFEPKEPGDHRRFRPSPNDGGLFQIADRRVGLKRASALDYASLHGDFRGPPPLENGSVRP